MELRHRHPADATTGVHAADVQGAPRDRPPDPGRRPADVRQGPADSSEQATGSRPADARPLRDDADRHDPDAEFKHGVPAPPGYLPDADRILPHSAAVPPRPIELHHEEHAPEGSSRPREIQDIDKGDGPRALLERPMFRDPLDKGSPDRYGNPLDRIDGTQIPCFRGLPRREQTKQGWAGDCGIIAALGSVAAHRPDDITSRVRSKPDGTYNVSLSEARRTAFGAAPTGRTVELSITPELPVYERDPATPAGAKAQEGAAWGPVMEKAFAGLDQTWTTEQQETWQNDWSFQCARDQEVGAKYPRFGPAPEGYARLNQGTNAWERAEVLTQLTGRESIVRELPAGPEDWRTNRVIRAQLEDNKPVLVCSRNRAYEHEPLPYSLEPAHVYEVTGVEKGKIVLRNPWNDDHPELMETDQFARNMQPWYTTLK